MRITEIKGIQEQEQKTKYQYFTLCTIINKVFNLLKGPNLKCL